MKKEDVLELIRQNGIGHQYLRCFLTSENDDSDRNHMSAVNHYKYHDHYNGHDSVLKIELSMFDLQQHEKILPEFPQCYFLIKKEEAGGKKIDVLLFCKFIEIKNGDIFVKILKVEFPNENNQRTKIKIYELAN
jgi:hypothetical protein